MQAPAGSRSSVVLLALAASSLSACGAASEPGAAERADSAGVQLVTSTGEDRPLAWRFTPETTVGGEEIYRVGRWNVGVDARGRIHVLDRDGKRVLRYEPDGTPLDPLGSPGQGPGQLEWPNALDVAPDGRVRVSDFGRGRVITWGPDGSLLGEEPTDDPGGVFRTTEAGEVRQRTTWGKETTSGLRLVRTGGDTVEIASVAWTGRPITLESCGMSFSGMTPIFTPSLRWDAAGARIAVVAGPEYDIDVRDGDRGRLRVRRRLAPPEATDALAMAELGEGMTVMTQGGRRVCEPGEVVEQRGTAAVMPLIEQVVVEPGGRLWVQRFVPGDDPGAIDVFDPDGEYVGTLPAATPLPIGFLPDGRVLTARADELDVQHLVVGRFGEGAG